MQLTARQWKWMLAGIGLIIVFVSVVATTYLVRQLADEERQKVATWLEAQRFLSEMSDEEAAICDVTLYTQLLQNNTTIPMVLTTGDGRVITGRNFGPQRDQDSQYLAGVVADLRAEGQEPIRSFETELYYEESRLLVSLRFFPLAQLVLVAAFGLLAYLPLSTVRRSEQNRVWVGMAKETAHQLGTPISAIMAWVEYLRAEYEQDEGLKEVADELAHDVDRLQLVAERFNKIGSTPELSAVPLSSLVGGVYDYMSKRAPRRVDFTVDLPDELRDVPVAVNEPLFAWVLENLVRNALDAMDGEGKLVITAVARSDKEVQLEVRDSGKGIPSSKHRTIFEPGFTTKARGWGLGLSLAKRIVEEYHGGKIFVKESAVGQGATLAVRVPMAS